jgi:hypothetical protein
MCSVEWVTTLFKLLYTTDSGGSFDIFTASFKLRLRKWKDYEQIEEES